MSAQHTVTVSLASWKCFLCAHELLTWVMIPKAIESERWTQKAVGGEAQPLSLITVATQSS